MKNFFFSSAPAKDVPVQEIYKDYISLLSSWCKRTHDAQIGHYIQSEKLYRTANITGWILISSTVFVTAMSFFAYGKDLLGLSGMNFYFIEVNSTNVQYIVIAVGVISAFFSGVVSQSRFAERAEQHRSAAGRYGNIRRDIELLLTKVQNKSLTDNNKIEAELDKIKLVWEYASVDAPLTKNKVIKKLKK